MPAHRGWAVLFVFIACPARASMNVPTFDGRVREAERLVWKASGVATCREAFEAAAGRSLREALREDYEVYPFSVGDFPLFLRMGFAGFTGQETAFIGCEVGRRIWLLHSQALLSPEWAAHSLIHELVHLEHCPRLLTGEVTKEQSQTAAETVAEVCVP